MSLGCVEGWYFLAQLECYCVFCGIPSINTCCWYLTKISASIQRRQKKHNHGVPIPLLEMLSGSWYKNGQPILEVAIHFAGVTARHILYNYQFIANLQPGQRNSLWRLHGISCCTQNHSACEQKLIAAKIPGWVKKPRDAEEVPRCAFYFSCAEIAPGLDLSIHIKSILV